MEFKDVYKFPLRIDKDFTAKVFTDDGHMAFDFPLSFLYPNGIKLSDETKIGIVGALNGSSEELLIPPTLRYSPDDTTIYLGDREFIVVRGWGYLTGIGGLHLPQEKAMELQDSFAEYIVEILNKLNNNKDEQVF